MYYFLYIRLPDIALFDLVLQCGIRTLNPYHTNMLVRANNHA